MPLSLEEAAQLVWSKDGRVSSANGACEGVLGRPASELLGRRAAEVLGLPEEKAAELTARAGDAPSTEFVSSQRESQRVPLRLRVVADGERVCAWVVNLESLLRGAPPLQISRLSSSLSHELRNPLSSVKMAVQTVARNPQLTERDQRRLSIANREVRTLERLLWLLSEYGRDAAPSTEQVALRTLVQEAAAMVEPELAERKVKLEIDEAEPCPKVTFDGARLRPVLAQLLLNVAVAHPEGSVVPVLLTRGDRCCRLHLTDPAVMPPAERETVFEPFGTLLARGAGLSLAALYRVMHTQGGSLVVEPTDGPGTVYTLTFPA